MRAEGTSDWYTAAHDEFAVVMDGEVEVELVKLDDPERLAPSGTRGSARPRLSVGRKDGLASNASGPSGTAAERGGVPFSGDKNGVVLGADDHLEGICRYEVGQICRS